MEHLRQQVLGSYFRNMAEGMQNMSPEDLARFRDMLAELNQMIEQRERGEDTYDFDGFMERHGDLFPNDPKTLDELLEAHGAPYGGDEPAAWRPSRSEQRRELQELWPNR